MFGAKKENLHWYVNILRAVWEALKSRFPKGVQARLKLDPTGERIKEGNKKEKPALNHKVVRSI